MGAVVKRYFVLPLLFFSMSAQQARGLIAPPRDTAVEQTTFCVLLFALLFALFSFWVSDIG